MRFKNTYFVNTYFMLDVRSKLVLKILAKECRDGNYKIVELSDIIFSLPKKYRIDSEALKHILTHLERQDMISVKYDDEDVYCLAILPYGFEILEKELNPHGKKEISRQNSFGFLSIVLSFVSALIGAILGVAICYFIIKIF